MNSDKLIRMVPLQPEKPFSGFGAPGIVAEEPRAAAIPASHYFWILRRHRWKILAFVVACVAATVIVSSRMTPIYESTATVDIDRDMPTGIVGQDSHRSGLNDSDQFLTTQVTLIQSDSVLRPVADQYHLRELERASGDADAYDPVRLHDAPVILKRLHVSRPPNAYLIQISYRSTEPQLAADVANGIAKSYLQHTYAIRFRSSASLSSFMEKQLEELKAKMERSSGALANFERELNVINPEEKTSIVSARLLQLNAEYTNAQADRVRKEAIYKLAKDASPGALQVSSQGEPLVKLTEKLNDAEQKFAETRTHYGVNHPEYKRSAEQVAELQRQLQQTRQDIAHRIEIDYQSARNRESMLEKAVSETKGEFDKLNARSFEYQALKREAEADKKLYEELIQRIREAGINAGFQNSSIRIADAARPALKPLYPKMGLNALLALLLSSLMGVAAAVMADMMSVSVRDPDQVLRLLNTEVIGSLPAVKSLRTFRVSLVDGKSPEATQRGLMRVRSSVRRNLRQYEDAIETLRNSVLLADFDRRLKSLMITSASPFEGKSTIASHFALANVKGGQKTLLIDGDLRRPSIQRVLDIEGEKGLADVLAQGVSWKDVLVRGARVGNLDILLAGSPSLRTPELIGPQLVTLIEEACKSYDLVILDSPPVQGFPEPLRMATTVDGVIVVAQSGRTSRKALASTIGILTRLRAHVIGVVLNQVNPDSGENGYYSYYTSHAYYKP
jgi:capsular exopolysaccharide synthesis family protein